MTGAMYAAVGGLRSHMSKLNVIGNNIANVNTYGYKSQRMTFKESIYGTSRSGSNGNTVSGGNNPSQIGYGCSVGTIDLNMSPSTYSPTGVQMDCYIDGDGFFMVGDKMQREVEYYMEDTTVDGVDHKAGEVKSVTWTGGVTSGSQLKDYDLTRVGDFWVDPDGYICNGDGKVLYGYARVQNPDYVEDATKAEIALAKSKGKDIESETIISTHLVPLRVPLQAAAPTGENGGKRYFKTENDTVTELSYDEYKAITDEAELAKITVTTVWEEGDPVYPFLGEDGRNNYADPEYPQLWERKVDNTTPAPGDPVTVPDGPGKGVSRIPTAENTASDAVSNVMPCQLRGMGIGKDGSIYGTANGKTVVIGYIAIASADNPNGVTHTGGPYYKCMPGAGNLRVSSLGIDLPNAYLGNKAAPDTAADALDGRELASANDKIWNEKSTQLQSQGLEASGTDLAYEFAEMVTTQRGYQANTRIVNVTDSMLEELVNMKR